MLQVIVICASFVMGMFIVATSQSITVTGQDIEQATKRCSLNQGIDQLTSWKVNNTVRCVNKTVFDYKKEQKS